MRLRKVKSLYPKPSSCLYLCEKCGTQEQVPMDVLAYFDAVDPAELGQPATFECLKCSGIMYPEKYLRAKRATP